ncbi:hypothetical protein [Priestia megaterium]|uniref:hypothetical protein n=1 Tax=Priestia megaterium TaxID=1404 RepID=UPI0035B5A26B
MFLQLSLLGSRDSSFKPLISFFSATYMKDEEDIDFVPKDVKFLGGEDLSTVLVYGYANSKEKTKEVSVAVDYGNDYRVTGYGYN